MKKALTTLTILALCAMPLNALAANVAMPSSQFGSTGVYSATIANGGSACSVHSNAYACQASNYASCQTGSNASCKARVSSATRSLKSNASCTTYNCTVTSAKPVNGTSLTAAANEVVRQVNMERAKRGLSQLRVDATLTQGACVRAQEIVSKFSHTRPDGTRGLYVVPGCYGENIAKGQQNADKVMAAWMTSKGHRDAILRASYGSIGVCAYQVNGIMYWVQLFGK